jgi:hypothetical protein
MRIVLIFALLCVVSGCATSSSRDFEGTQEYQELSTQLDADEIQLKECVGTYLNQYAANHTASHTEVAEATVSKCRTYIQSMCSATTDMAAMNIKNARARADWKVGVADKCVEKRSQLLRDIFIRELVEKRN